MDIYKHIIKQKYILSEKYCDIKFGKEDINDKTKIDRYLYLFDIMNPYPLFPTIIDFNISNYFNNKIDPFKYINNNKNNKDIPNNKNYNKYNNKLRAKLDKIDDIFSKIDSDDRAHRILFSWELKDAMINLFNGENVTVAWLKCYEILEHYNFCDNTGDIINHFGICEQPGAFVFAINHYVKQKLGKKYDFILQSLNSNIFKEAFKPEINLYKKYKDNYDYGIDATGDVTNLDNIIYYRKTYYKKHFDIITADCGQDCHDDFTKQEDIMLHVIVGQFILAISLCDKGTNYFFKLYTVNHYLTKDNIMHIM